MGIFKKIKEALKKTKEAIARKLDSLLSHGEINEEFYEELTDILISSDVGPEASERIVDNLRYYARKNKIRTSEDVKNALREVITEMFERLPQVEFNYPAVITIIGVNGVGKTTTIGKLAHYFKSNKKDVTLVAADTFRAAASDQLTEWANRNKVKIVKHAEGADAAAVVFDGLSSAIARGTDVTIIDTAGRLHTKTNLMEELGKINRVVSKGGPGINRYNFIVIDATTGQNAMTQIRAFNDYIHINGVILTKLDGTAKGGVVLTIAQELNIPVVFIGTGEGIDDIEEFDAKNFAENLI